MSGLPGVFGIAWTSWVDRYMTLRLFGSEPTSVFALARKDENSATFALGWVIERCPTFLKLLVTDVVGPSCLLGVQTH